MKAKESEMNRISQLLYKKITGEITHEELVELERWATDETRRRLLASTDDYERMGRVKARRDMIDYERPMAEMALRISRINRPRRLKRFAAAASLLLLIGLSVVLFKSTPQPDLQTEAVAAAVNLEDIKPGTVKAILTTSTGDTFQLAQNNSETMLDYTKNVGSTKYSHLKKIEELSLDVPRGGEYMIVLEDSTKVWLNSQALSHP